MKYLRAMFTLVLAVSAVTGCAALTPESYKVTQFPDEAVCHRVTAGQRTTVYCGSPDQWAELNRRVAMMQAGVTCRWARTPRETCLSAEEWVRVDRRQALMAPGFNLESSQSSHSSPTNTGAYLEAAIAAMQSNR